MRSQVVKQVAVILLIVAARAAAQGEFFTLPPLPEADKPASEIDQLALRIEALELQLKKDPPQPEAAAAKAAEEAKVTYPVIRSTGFFQLDWGGFYQDANNRATVGDIQDGLGFRRARFAAAGKVTEQTSFIVEFDMAQAQPRFVDVWMQFNDTPFGNIRIGRDRKPLGMTEPTSIRELPFLERPSLFALSPFRQTGIMLFDTAFDQRMTWALSGYRYLSDFFGNVYADQGGYGTSGRTTFLPLDGGDERLVHLGFGYSFNDPGRDEVIFVNVDEFFVGQNPILGIAGLSVLPIVGVPPFVNTGLIPTQNSNLFNVEGAVSFGRLVFQSEARWATVEGTSGESNTFGGAYAHLRYVLTGETIPYLRESGVFGRVRPCCPVDHKTGGRGAWEVAARVSYLDLNGMGLVGPGRRLTNATLGLNWYLNNFTKFQLNWISASLNDPTLGSSTAGTVALRAQIDY